MALVKLSSLDLDGLELYCGRTDSQLRDGIGVGDPGGFFIAESMNVIEHALESDIVPASLFVEEQSPSLRRLPPQAASLPKQPSP